ncbi:MAG: hypothetical protein LUC98_12400 [Lachnospiraceae bacterium]|nr:hypothetical protein [Lachnospiraceae bacterium]
MEEDNVGGWRRRPASGSFEKEDIFYEPYRKKDFSGIDRCFVVTDDEKG